MRLRELFLYPGGCLCRICKRRRFYVRCRTDASPPNARTNISSNDRNAHNFDANPMRRPLHGRIHPAEGGTRVKREVHNARGTGTFEAYELECKVYARLNFTSTSGVRTASSGGSDCTTAACFMLGETSDSLLSPRADRVSPCDSREEKFKAVDRVPRN